MFSAFHVLCVWSHRADACRHLSKLICLLLHISCSDGVGHTGTFICIHSQLERLKTEGVVDFFQAAKSACIQRAGLIPDDAYLILKLTSL